MLKKMLLVSAISAAFAASPAVAQQQQQQQGGGQQGSNQIRLQERAQFQGTPIYISTAGVRQVQQKLNQMGFDVGNVDGVWSNQTARGVQDFQRSRGLEPTGTLTLALLNSLKLQNVLSSAPETAGGGNQRWLQEAAVANGTPLMISPAGVRQIQQELNKRGYDVGHVDGTWNDETSNAARNFQLANGLEPNGKPDVNLIAALGGTQDIFTARTESTGSPGNSMQWTQEVATGSGVNLWASPATVRQIQQALNTRGYDVGRVDGQWGKTTKRAVENFQKANGLAPTGTLTTSLLASLGQSNWMQGQIGGGQSTGGQSSQQQQGFNQGQQGGQSSGGQQQQSSGQQGGQSSGGQGGQQQQGGQSSGGQGGQQQQGGQSSGGQQQQSSGQQGSFGQPQGGQSSGGQGGQQQQSGQQQQGGQSSGGQSSGGQSSGGQSSGGQSSGGQSSQQQDSEMQFRTQETGIGTY